MVDDEDVAEYEMFTCVTLCRLKYNWSGKVCGDWRQKKTWQVEKCMVPRCKAARKPRGEKDRGNRKPDK